MDTRKKSRLIKILNTIKLPSGRICLFEPSYFESFEEIIFLSSSVIDTIRLDIGSQDPAPTRLFLEPLINKANKSIFISYAQFHWISSCKEAIANYFANQSSKYNLFSNLDSFHEYILERTKYLCLYNTGSPTRTIVPLTFFEDVITFPRNHHILVALNAFCTNICSLAFKLFVLRRDLEKKCFCCLIHFQNPAIWLIGAWV